MFPSSRFGGAAAGQPQNPNKDAEVASPPEDGISSLRFSPAANHLAATSWDCSVRVWEVASGGGLGFVGGAGGGMSAAPKVKMWNLATNQTQQVAQHEGGVKEVHFVRDENRLVTGSWDKTLKYWDLRSPNPIYTFTLNDMVYAMDLNTPLLVVATPRDKNCHLNSPQNQNDTVRIFDVRQPQQAIHTYESLLRWQTRCVACFTDQKGFYIGSIEGRVGVQPFEDTHKKFTFKCHRSDNNVYAVNSIATHPVYGTFATAGSDGGYHFWDKDTKQRLKAMERCGQSISCAAFNHNGSIYAYGVSYDWSRGCSAYNPQRDKNYILMHAVVEGDAKSRPKNPPPRVR
eukprot:evm.model.scf_4402.1 EVM.evm.TU.scf_4402.1   scf_4402:4072-7195(+)